MNVRSTKAHMLATDWSQRTGRTVTQVVEDALMAYNPGAKIGVSETELWGTLLHSAQEEVTQSDDTFEIEDLYDPESGAPI